MFLSSVLVLVSIVLNTKPTAVYIMPSRKRAKGKERKASLAIKRAALARASWFQFIKYGEQNKSIQCRHGLDELSISIPPQGHCVSNMLDVFGKDTDDSNEQSMYEFMEELFNEHPEVWGDDNNRTMAMNILLNLGTNHILRGEYITASSYARAAAVIEKHEMGGSFESAFFRGARNVIKINGGNRRDLLKFYYKRISCSCLKFKYKNAAKLKRGNCFGCLQTFDRTVLYVCG